MNEFKIELIDTGEVMTSYLKRLKPMYMFYKFSALIPAYELCIAVINNSLISK